MKTFALFLASASAVSINMNAWSLIKVQDDEKYYAAGDQGMTPNGVEYIRTIPEQYNDESENKFMFQIINNYALEQKTEKGEPSGIFKMDKTATMNAVKAVIK